MVTPNREQPKEEITALFEISANKTNCCSKPNKQTKKNTGRLNFMPPASSVVGLLVGYKATAVSHVVYLERKMT